MQKLKLILPKWFNHQQNEIKQKRLFLLHYQRTRHMGAPNGIKYFKGVQVFKHFKFS